MGVPYAEVIGDPIAHSKSPIIHKFWLAQFGLERDYRATLVTPETLPDYLADRRADPDWRGCNLTMPLKVRAMEYLDEASEIVAGLGAVNCIVRRRDALYGSNFDALAVLQSLVQTPWRGHVVIMGAGGAARAALWAVQRLDFDRITIMSRDWARAAALASSLKAEVDFAPLGGTPQCNLLINATPLGMKGQPALPITLAAMPAGSGVFEMVYDPLVTPLVAEARDRKLKVFDGLEMLIEQASLSFVGFFDAGIAVEQRAAVRERLVK